MPGQLIRELNPRQTLGIPIVKRWSDQFRVIEASDGDVDQAGDVVSVKADLSSAARAEAPSCARGRLVTGERAVKHYDLGLVKHCPGDGRSGVCATAHGAMADCHHDRVTIDAIPDRSALATAFLYSTCHETAFPAACPSAVAASIPRGSAQSPTRCTSIPAARSGAASASSGTRGVEYATKPTSAITPFSPL